MRSPTERSLKLLRDRGYTVTVSEYFDHRFKRRHDLFGWIDILAIHPETKEVLGVQTTTGTNLSARIKKAEKLSCYHDWIMCGAVAEFMGWRKLLKKKGGKVKIWVPKIVRVDLGGLY